MDECLNKNNDGGKTLPVAYLVCNQTPPSKDKPSLMSFEEVLTLFHEFGHGLQHMLTTVNLLKQLVSIMLKGCSRTSKSIYGKLVFS